VPGVWTIVGAWVVFLVAGTIIGRRLDRRHAA
jgi:hypothetical protein